MQTRKLRLNQREGLAQVTLLEIRPLIPELSWLRKTEERALHWACSVFLVLWYPTVVLEVAFLCSPRFQRMRKLTR